jgi:predicted amidohydrolase YtcJ
MIKDVSDQDSFGDVEPQLFVADAIYTGEPGRAPTAMLVKGETIIAVGDEEEFTHFSQKNDFRGSTIMPGFNDAHVHLTMMVLMAQGVDLSPETTPDEASLRKKLDHALQGRPGEWIRGSRYDHMRSSDGEILHRDILDSWFPHNPVVIGHVGAHWGVANSLALEAARINEQSADPEGGFYGRDDSGRLTGYLSEQAYFDYAYPSLTQKPWVCAEFSDSALSLLEKSAQTLLAAGITSIGDAMVGLEEYELLLAAHKAGRLPIRVNALITFPHIADMKRRGISSGHGDNWLRVGGVKMFTDGAVAGRSCAVSEPFEGSDDFGILTTDLEQLTSLIQQSHEANLAVAIHANGERAISMALASIEAAGPAATEYRDRIEHCSIVTDELLDKMKSLNVMAVPFAGYPYYHGDNLLKWYGAQRLERMFAHRQMLDMGIPVAGSSDYPCGPLSPFDGLQSLVTRTSSSGTPVGISQKISIEEALYIYTQGSAEIELQQENKGKIAPGFLADFIVVNQNPLTSDPFRLSEIAVESTWVGGQRRWEDNGI